MNTIFLFVSLFTFPHHWDADRDCGRAVLDAHHPVLRTRQYRLVALKFFQTMEHFTLLAIPFFILSGHFLTTGGVARRMINFAISVVGHLPGGLAIASVLAWMFFAAVSGSSPATVVAIGSIVIAGMVRVGYTQSFATGVIVNAGTLGILIPPSIVLVVYAATPRLGRAAVHGRRHSRHSAWRRADDGDLHRGSHQEPAAAAESVLGRTLQVVPRRHFGADRSIFIVMGGIYGGIFTPTEAAAVAAVYAWHHRGVHLRRPEAFRRAPRVNPFVARVGYVDVHHRQCASCSVTC